MILVIETVIQYRMPETKQKKAAVMMWNKGCGRLIR